MARKKKKSFISRFIPDLSGFTNIGQKAIFGKPKGGKVGHDITINQYQADFTLTNAEYQDWVDEAYKANDTIHRALNLLFNAVCEAPLVVCDEHGDYVYNKTFDLLEHINELDTPKTFLRTLLMHMYIGDVAYIEKVFDKANRVTELGLLRPDKVKLETANRGISRYVYEPNGSVKIPYAPREIIRLPFVDPLYRTKGHSPLKSLAMIIDMDNEQKKHIMCVLQNGGIPGTVISAERELGMEEAQAMAKSFDQKTAGSNRGKTIVLHGGVSANRFGDSLKDLEAKELFKVTEAKILSALGIPLPVYGSISSTEASTYDNAKTALKMFWRQTIIPLQTMVEDFLNNDRDLLNDRDRRKGIRIKFDRSGVEALKEDMDILAGRARDNYLAGIATLNEARKVNGLETVQDGDEFKQQFAMPTEEALVDEAVTEEDQDKENEADQEREAQKAQIIELETKSQEQLAEKEALKNRIEEYEIATKRMEIADKYAFEFFKLARKHLTKHISDAQKLIGKKDIEPSVIITKQIERFTIEEGLGKLQQEWSIEMAADAEKVMKGVIAESASQASASLGHMFSIEDEAVTEALKANQFKFAAKISETSANQIRKTMISAFEEGQSAKDLRKAIQKLGDQFNSVRSEMIARTESVRAANQGARLGYSQAGVELLKYSAVLDDNTSEICSHLDGKVISINEKFFEDDKFVSASGKTTDLSYSEGVPEPPAHPNCRSTIIPVFRD